MTLNKVFGRIYGANDFSPFVPEWWANESLAILEENMIAANLVHRDFEPMFQEGGDIVNTRRPSEFTAVRKAKTDNITIQDATAENVAVKLDQHIHVSFQVNDIDQRSSMKNLIETYIKPAGLALARAADRVVLGQYPRFLPNVVGGLGQGSNANNYMLKTLASLKVKLDIQKCYEDGRNLIYSPLTEGMFLGSDSVYKVNEAGGAGARVSGFLGRIMGLNQYSAVNMSDVLLNPTGIYKQGAVNGAVLAGATSIPTDGWAASGDVPAVGEFIKVNGFPVRVTAVSGTWASTATVMTLTVANALPAGAADNDVVTVYKPVKVNFAAGYAVGYNKGIEFDGTGTGYEPQIGQAVRLAGVIYTVIGKPTSTSLLLDRSLEAAVVDNDNIYPLPHGSYSLAFHRNAITAAIRPLAPVPAGMGVRSATLNYNNLTVRATMGYDITSQNTVVTLDFLMGIQVLDEDLGCLLLA